MNTLLDIGAGKVAIVANFYKVSEYLGNGRFSEVYKAFDKHNQADVALKLYVAFDEHAHEQAAREQDILRKLSALNSDYFPKPRPAAKHRIQNRTHPLLVLELGTYVTSEGEKRIIRLSDIIPANGSANPPDLPEADFWIANNLVHWLIHMVQGVKLLHSIDLIHRDLKPSNILIKRGPGQSVPIPFFLDFNSATDSTGSDSKSGTPRYLPPEVTMGKRLEPHPQDDLWAIAMVSWQILHGQDTSPNSNRGLHHLITGAIPDGIIRTLRQALNVNADERFADADQMLRALENAVVIDTKLAPGLSSDEVARARTEMERIRRAIARALAPPGELVVPKETDEAVTTLLAWLSEEETQALSLIDELVRLGPVAIPVCLQQGYRLNRDRASYRDVVSAITQLAKEDLLFAQRSIDAYALSSNVGVRSLCWEVCEALHYFPKILLDSLESDEGILLPDERVKLADLCIRFADEPIAVLALVKYLCREYILDRNKYHALATTVARRMHQLNVSQRTDYSEAWMRHRETITALLIAEESQKCIWEGMVEFRRLRDTAITDTERGLIELLAEAFAATGLGALEVLKAGKVPRRTGVAQLPVFRRFAIKAAKTTPVIRTWLIQQSADFPSDTELAKVKAHLERPTTEIGRSPKTLFEEYLRSTDHNALNELRFWPTPEVLTLVDSFLSSRPSLSEIDPILKLLRGCENRHRGSVIRVVLKHWDTLSRYDYTATVDVLTWYDIPSNERQRAVDLLRRDLDGTHSEPARHGLEQILR